MLTWLLANFNSGTCVTNVFLIFEQFCPLLKKVLIRAKTKYFLKNSARKLKNQEFYHVEKIEKFWSIKYFYYSWVLIIKMVRLYFLCMHFLVFFAGFKSAYNYAFYDILLIFGYKYICGGLFLPTNKCVSKLKLAATTGSALSVFSKK